MKRLLLTFLIALVGLGLPARGWADDENYPPLRDENYAPNRIVPGPRGEPLEIELWADRDNEDTYYEGENITLYFQTNRDAYVTLYNIDAQGNVFLLYPQHPDAPHFVRGGVTYELPDRRDDYDLWITGPPGVEFVQAVASLRPFDVPEDWPSYSRSNRASRRYPSSSLRVDDENIEEFIYDLNSRLIPIKRYPDECAEDLYTFYVKPRPHTVYRPVVYDYGYWDFDFPYGSEIWIDGAYCGVAPFYDYRLYPGTHIVWVSQPGCPPYVRHIYVYPKSRYTVNFSISFNFGYRNYRYYRYYYPYTYFCLISPDYRYKYRHQYYGEARYKDVFRKDVRFKGWVRDAGDRDFGKSKLLGGTVREKLRRDGGKPVINRRDDNRGFIDRGETRKRSSIREVLEKNRDSDRQRIRSRDGDRERISSREEGKSKSVYETWEKSRKGRDTDDGQVKEKTRYRGWEEGKKERSSGSRDEGERLERSKRERSGGNWEGRSEGSRRERPSRNSDEQKRVEGSKKESHRSSEPAKVERSKQDGGGKEGRSRGSSKKGRDD